MSLREGKGRDDNTGTVSFISVLWVVRKQAMNFHGLSAQRNVAFVAMVK